MNKYKVVLLSGDGIGPEISEVSKKILKKLSRKYSFEIEINEQLFGGIAYEKKRISCTRRNIRSMQEK